MSVPCLSHTRHFSSTSFQTSCLTTFLKRQTVSESIEVLQARTNHSFVLDFYLIKENRLKKRGWKIIHCHHQKNKAQPLYHHPKYLPTPKASKPHLTQTIEKKKKNTHHAYVPSPIFQPASKQYPAKRATRSPVSKTCAFPCTFKTKLLCTFHPESVPIYQPPVETGKSKSTTVRTSLGPHVKKK